MPKITKEVIHMGGSVKHSFYWATDTRVTRLKRGLWNFTDSV